MFKTIKITIQQKEDSSKNLLYELAAMLDITLISYKIVKGVVSNTYYEVELKSRLDRKRTISKLCKFFNTPVWKEFEIIEIK